MLEIDITKAASFVNEGALASATDLAGECMEAVREGSGAGSEWLGWRRILDEPNDAELEEIDTLAGSLREDIDVLVVCGIGGSYLGGKALIDALTPAFVPDTGGEQTEVLFAGQHLSGQYLDDLMRYLEAPRADGTPRRVAVNVISKSGTTLETALSFRLLRRWMHERYPEQAAGRIICTTGPEGGVLNTLADRHGYRRFVIPDDIGGRFSVLTPVGLFPAAVAGIDIRTLYYGAVTAYEELERQPGSLLSYAGLRYLFEQQGGKSVDVLTSFEPEMHGFSLWLQQLFGESEGKQERGLFPVAARYSTDLHSLGQFMQQGAPHMIETFIEVKKSKQSLTIEEAAGDDDQLNYLAGKSFHEINQKALEATRAAHDQGEVPCITVSLAERNAQQIGAFIYFFELFTAVYCYMLGVNPFNQPGVEDYKQGMYKLLGKG